MEQGLKYKLIPAEGVYPGMFQIQALRDIPRYKVHAGDLGGLVQGETKLSQQGDCWVEQGAMVWHGAFVTRDAFLGRGAEAIDSARIEGEAQVFGASSIRGHAVISGSSRIWGNIIVSGKTRVSGNSVICGRETLSGDRVLHDHNVEYVDTIGAVPNFSQLQKERGESEPPAEPVVCTGPVRAPYRQP